MKRRELLAGMAGSGVFWPSLAFAQAPSKRPLLGYLSGNSKAPPDFYAFLQGMAERGYVEGKDYDMSARWADGDLNRLALLAEELVQLKPDVIETDNTTGAVAAHRATSKIPIVCPVLALPELLDLTKSDSRPGGNVTGRLLWTSTLPGKQLQLGLEAAPAAKTLGMLIEINNVASTYFRRDTEVAAAILKLKFVPAEVRSPEDLETALSKLPEQGVDLVYAHPGPLFNSNRSRIAALALKLRLPTIHLSAQFARDGWMMAYGVDVPDSHRQVAAYVDKILKGAKPSELPLEFPTKLTLALNLKTATALGLVFPRSLFAQANEIIE